MDTTFPGNALMGRAIISPLAWTAAYWAIILAEALTGFAFALGAIAMLRGLRADAAQFRRAKRFVYLGAGLGFLVWFFGFMVVAGRMVRDVAVEKLEWPGGGFPFLHADPGRADICQPAQRLR